MTKTNSDIALPPVIRKAVVIGAGTMGAQIAALLANAGVKATLLDIVPNKLTDQEQAAGLSLGDRRVRDRIVDAGLASAKKARPAAFDSSRATAWITTGNLEDDFDAIGDADWIIEVVVENLKIKQDLMARIDERRADDALVSTNTSGIPVSHIAEGRSDSFRRHFLGTHFFNPPRYLKLLEVIPTEETAPEAVDYIKCFAEERLGKGVVICKDTPNFIANRLGSVGGAFLLDFVLRNGYTVEEVDALTGPLIGRPKTASFRLLDLIGLDVASHVRQHLAEAMPDDEAQPYLTSQPAEKLASAMIEKGWLGNKAGQGFYKRVKTDEGKAYWPLDLESLEYKAPTKPRFESVGKAKDLPTAAERIKVMLGHGDRAAELVKNITFHALAYASHRVPEIADTPAPIDHAMRWGFMHDQGPFELWDDMGVAEMSAAMQDAGYIPADWVQAMLEAGFESFYRQKNGQAEAVYDPAMGDYRKLEEDPKEISLASLKATGGLIDTNAGASLIDMGGDVACLEFHAQGNALDDDVFAMIDRALNRVEVDFAGLVIGHHGENFSYGANLFAVAVAAQNEMWDQLELAVRTFQELNMRMRFHPRPIVVAPAGRALGGGCEMTMHAARAVAASETYLGLVEVGVGLIPAGGGCKEMLRRRLNPSMRLSGANALPPLQAIFETVGQASVGTSAEESRDLGFLGGADRVVMNREHLLAEAKREVLHLAAGYRPPTPEPIYAAGRDALAALRVGVYMLREGGYISEYDAHVGGQLARVLSGGELSRPAWVDPWTILDLEREAFLSLAGEPLTQARMWHLLQTGKPLRN
jgi:3-hydroxyacyl-CoA dehydrogenase